MRKETNYTTEMFSWDFVHADKFCWCKENPLDNITVLLSLKLTVLLNSEEDSIKLSFSSREPDYKHNVLSQPVLATEQVFFILQSPAIWFFYFGKKFLFWAQSIL